MYKQALVLNRVTIYSSTRRHISLDWRRRLALRVIPIILLARQTITLLRALRCQVSPEYSVLRYGTPGKHTGFDYSGEGGFFYSLSSLLLFWEDEQRSCSASEMGQTVNSSDIPYGSFSLVWPVFLLLCLSHFVETLSCALQGRPVVTEAGMSIFEHSLAFAEAETMISQSVGLGLFGLPRDSGSHNDPSSSNVSPKELLSRAQILERLNITPELLLICLLSCSNSLTSNILDVFGRQSRYRFINTTFWGICFMVSLVFGMLNNSPLRGDPEVLKFPTVCIVGFIPHLLIFVGILVCGCIYCLALLITAFSLPRGLPMPMSLRQRFALAHENMQGASQIRNVRLNMHEDFYTTLVRIGYSVLTAASEAVFLNEGKMVSASTMTWLEEDRLAELASSRGQKSAHRNFHSERPDPPPLVDEIFNFELPKRQSEWQSGYSREQKFETSQKGARSIEVQAGLGGVGAFRGTRRGYHILCFFRGISVLMLGWSAFGLIGILKRLGISSPPQWLAKLAGVRRNSTISDEDRSRHPPLDFWILTDQGELELPENDEFDVEREMRKRESAHISKWSDAEEVHFDHKLYNWWRLGGSWGNQDSSGDYQPPDDFDDTTSVASLSTNADESEWENEPDGRSTPTPQDPYSYTRSATPPHETLLDSTSLARLLNPKDSESKTEARILASHLAAAQEGRKMTRSQFQKQMERERARVLISNKFHHLKFQGGATATATRNPSDGQRPTAEEESDILENLILSRRLSSYDANSCKTPSQCEKVSWSSGASGLGPDGPQCVVCQAEPRTIITWPCRCLCICEDCRVSLAMNNFGSCVTCRREVGGFVRLWVP